MKRLCLLIVTLIGTLAVSACGAICPSGLTTAQCANWGTHTYARTYDFVEGCGQTPGLVEGLSEFTWAFSPGEATVTFAALIPGSPPQPNRLIEIGPDAYRPVQQSEMPSEIHLISTGFTWWYFDPDTENLCYQVNFTLSQ